MTEINENKPLPLAIQQFILHWGEMGSQWGVNRSVAQIHALLYVSSEPLTAENICATLGLARSNVSNSIRELLSWKLIRRAPVLGDRREHYEAETDIWEIVRLISRGRKERELDPAAAVLGNCVERARTDGNVDDTARRRLGEMHDFVESISRWHDEMLTLPRNQLVTLIRMGSRVARLLGSTRRGDREIDDPET